MSPGMERGCRWVSVVSLWAIAATVALSFIPAALMAVMTGASGKPAMQAAGLLFLVAPALLLGTIVGALRLLSRRPRLYPAAASVVAVAWVAAAVKVLQDGPGAAIDTIIAVTIGMPMALAALITG